MRKLAILLLLISAGCNFVYNPGSSARVTSKRPLFGFDDHVVSDLVIMKNDPHSGDRWTAQLHRKNGVWEILSAPEGTSLSDKRADAGLVQHLLDTLRTLAPLEDTPNGTLESFGLQPPQFALRWVTPEGSEELRLGDRLKDGSGRYAWVRGEVYLVGGAALQMVDYVTSFSVLRHRKLSTLTSDDVDELEVRRARGKKLYAQRESGDWVDQKRKRLSIDVGVLLEGLTHLRIKEFLDDPEETSRWRTRVERQSQYEVVMKDRHGNPLKIKIFKASGARLMATVSSRGDAVFELHPEALRYFEK